MLLTAPVNSKAFRPRLALAAVLPLALMIVLAGLLSWQIRRLLQVARSDEQAHLVLEEGESAQRLMVDMETGLRGYQLTGQTAFLEPLRRAQEQIGGEFDTLQHHVADDPAMGRQLDQVRSLYRDWSQYASGVIAQHVSGASTPGATLEGKQRMDQIRAAMRQFIQDAEARHQQRNAYLQRTAKTGVGLTLGLSLVIAAIFAAFTTRQLLRLARNYRQAVADIHEQALAVAESEGRFRAVFEMAAVGIAQMAPDGTWLAFNRKLCDITGYTPDELKRTTWRELTYPDDVASEIEQRQRLINGEIETYTREKRYVRKGGGVIWVSITVSLVRTHTGEPKYFVAVVQDISARKYAEAAQISSETRLRLALDAANMGMWAWDLDTGQETWSQSMRELFGLPTASPLRHEEFLNMIHPEDRELVQKASRAAIEGKAPYRSEYRVLREDGSVRWMSGRGDVIRDASGRPHSLMGVTMDITSRKRAERERLELLNREQKARAEAEAANRRKDQFLAVLSHELRTPLTPVMARLALLKRDAKLAPELRPALDMIRRNVELEARLIEDLLDVTRISRGQLHLNFAIVDAHEKVRDALEIYRAEIAAKNLHVTLDLRAPRHHVRADPARLQQVFWNLISNAVKYTPAGESITIRSWNRPAGPGIRTSEMGRIESVAVPPDGKPAGAEGATATAAAPAGENERTAVPTNGEPQDTDLLIEVSDTGIGIEPETMARLFDPFEQGEQTLTRRFGGLGLGLSISRTLVEMHGGKLVAASAGKGMGASFTVQIKSVAPTAAEAPPPARPAVAGPKRPLRILLVEDNEDTLRVLARLLRVQGYQVKPAATVKAALDVAACEEFDLVISDIGLPDGSGWELMQQLQLHHPVRGIALSGFTMDEDIQKSRSAGFLEHLAKPIDPEELEEAIQRVAG